MTTIEVLEASKLFDSRSDIHKCVKNKSVKINNQQVENVNDPIEIGDFLNFAWFPMGAELIRKHGNVFLVVGKGKKTHSLLMVVGDKIENLTDNWEAWQSVF